MSMIKSLFGFRGGETTTTTTMPVAPQDRSQEATIDDDNLKKNGPENDVNSVSVGNKDDEKKGEPDADSMQIAQTVNSHGIEPPKNEKISAAKATENQADSEGNCTEEVEEDSMESRNVESSNGDEKKGNGEDLVVDEGEGAASSGSPVKHSHVNPRHDIHPYVGKRVQILEGLNSGLITKILKVKSRGWWLVEGLETSVHSGKCVILDEVNDDDMHKYYSNRGMEWRGTRSDRRGEKRSGITEGDGENQEDNGSVLIRDYQIRKKYKLQAPLLMSDVVHAAQESNVSLFCEDEEQLLDTSQAPEPWLLPPIVLEPENNVPVALRHLNASDMLEIFDRKTGLILEDKIAVKDLPKVLRENAQYEPIIPPKHDDDSIGRRGRTSPTLRVYETVRPQSKTKLKRAMDVVVTSGPYKGKSGRIHSILPGGWYLVDGVLAEDIPMVMSPDCVEKIKLRDEASEQQPIRQQVPLQQQNGSSRVNPPVTATIRETQDNQTSEQSDAPGVDEKSPASQVADVETTALRNTFKAALNQTIRAEAVVTKSRLEALQKDKEQLEMQLKALGTEESTDLKRLQKRLEYVKSCLLQWQEIYQAKARSAIAAQEAVFGDDEDKPH